MNFIAWATLLFAIAGNAAANILIKRAGMQASDGFLYFQPAFLIGVVLFGLNLISYTFALKTLPISLAYPTLLGGTLILVLLASVQMFGETLTLTRLAGSVLILIGVLMVVRET